MKLALRVAAFTLVVAAAVAGNSIPKNPTVASMHKASVPGPVPLCNPFTQSCPSLR
jgi:hypothetical protein